MDRSVDGLQQVPENRSGPVAEDRALAAGENGAHEAAVEAQAAVSHGVDAAVNAVEMPALDAPGDAVLANADVVELRNRNDTVLSRRDSCQRRIERVALFPHVRE
jgi:hypothetical protein